MRIYKDRLFNDEYDLDNEDTYSHLPDNIKELRILMLSEIGYSYLYMNKWYSEIFNKTPQKDKVEKMVDYFAENEKYHYQDKKWYKEQVFLFQEEIENMI